MNDKITELCNVYSNKLEINKKYLNEKDEQLIASLKQQSYVIIIIKYYYHNIKFC